MFGHVLCGSISPQNPGFRSSGRAEKLWKLGGCPWRLLIPAGPLQSSMRQYRWPSQITPSLMSADEHYVRWRWGEQKLCAALCWPWWVHPGSFLSSAPGSTVDAILLPLTASGPSPAVLVFCFPWPVANVIFLCSMCWEFLTSLTWILRGQHSASAAALGQKVKCSAVGFDTTVNHWHAVLGVKQWDTLCSCMGPLEKALPPHSVFWGGNGELVNLRTRNSEPSLVWQSDG